MSPEEILAAAEAKLLRAQRAYARQLLGLIAAELRRQHPEAVTLTVLTDRRRTEAVPGDLLDADGDVVRPDPGRCVVARSTADDPLGGTVTTATRDVASLLRRALQAYDGPLEQLLGFDEVHGLHCLDLARA